MRDDPIDAEQGSAPFVSEVIDLDGVRVRFGRSRACFPACEHKRLVYSTAEKRIWCEDCQNTVENFDAFMTLTRYFGGMVRAVRKMTQEAEGALASTVRRRATKVLDHAWSSRLEAVGCPHCSRGILPEDFAGGIRSRTSREMEMARRKRDSQREAI